jgi:aspartate/methionine/tyrosine aminotransferase
MAGYRCGYLVVHQDAPGGNNEQKGSNPNIDTNSNVFEQMLKVQDTIPIGPARIAQVAALAAMQEETPGQGKAWVHDKFQTLQPGRKAICQALQSMKSETPLMGGTGAMYVMAKLPYSIPNDKAFAEQLVKDFGVAVIPGSFCGFPGWIRVCYSNLPPEKCLQAAERLKKGIQELCR